MKRGQLLKQYYIFVKDKEWQKAKTILIELIEKNNKGFWFYTNLSSVYFELKEYENALKYSEIAYSIKPESPLVLWDHAGSLLMLKRKAEAINLYKKILAMGDLEIAYERTQEGLKWTYSLKNDSNFRIAECYYFLEDFNLALEFIQIHLQKRKRGQMSLYSKRDANKLFKVILQMHNTISS